MAGASMIIGVDINPDKKAMAEKFGMTHFVNPAEVEGDLVPYIQSISGGGPDFSFECIGKVEIGWVLSVGSVIGLLGQMPGGAIVDAARSERLVAGLGVSVVGFSALGYAAWPILPVVMAAAICHAAASCVLGPSIAAISLGLVGPRGIGERLGRNARFASLGNGSAAGLMGLIGSAISSRASKPAKASRWAPRCAASRPSPSSASTSASIWKARPTAAR